MLKSLKTEFWSVPAVRTFYNKLRDEVIGTVCRNWQNSGYFYEDYDQNGKGEGALPFDGYTSVITLIIGEA